jgi:predicted amidophosphoribosyltransferase
VNQHPFKICSKCGTEYSVEAQVCADCGGTLVFPQDYGKRFEAPAEGEDLVLIREATLGYLKELLELVAKKGIRAGIRLHDQEPGACSPRSCASQPLFGLYVAKGDESAAKEIDRTHWLRGAPEHASSFTYTESELHGICPACSSPVPEGAAACPECGLVVGSVEDVATCPDCGAEVGDEATRCPRCGAEFE